MPASRVFRIAAVSDIHYGKHSGGALRPLFDEVSEKADVLLLGGDLTNYGLPEEAELLAKDLREHLRVPAIAVLGNHDFESDQVEDVCAVLEGAGVEILDGTCTTVGEVGFAGVRGFGGGFGRWALTAWGEPAWKALVQEAVDEALKLDKALARLGTEHRIALLHYAPICATVEGEPEEIWPFLGSSRLEEPLNRYAVAAAFHGHAHAGTPEGQTTAGVPVFNVATPVLSRAYPDRPPYRLFKLPLTAPAKDGRAAVATTPS